MTAKHDSNFWDNYPDLLLMDEFSKVYEEDKSKKKEESSLLMWAIDYANRPDSTYFNLPDKYSILAEKLMKKEKFNWKKVEDIVKIYKEICLTDAERALVSWNETMLLRDTAIKDLYRTALASADVDTLKIIDTMLANTAKMFADYKKVKQEFEAEKTQKHGKRNMSLSEKGEM